MSSIVNASGDLIGCDLVSPSETILRMRSLSGVSSTETSLPCAVSSVTSPPVPAGMYDVTPELHASGELLATATDQPNVIVWSGSDTMLRPVEFVIGDSGDLEISLQAQSAVSNCQPVSAGGAAIASNTISLTRAGGGCAPITLIRIRDGTTIGQYVINCSSPMVARCIESDETLTASDVPSGSYTIRIRGRIASIDCWQVDSSLQVPTQGQALTATLTMTSTGTAGCPRL